MEAEKEVGKLDGSQATGEQVNSIVARPFWMCRLGWHEWRWTGRRITAEIGVERCWFCGKEEERGIAH